MFIDYMLVCIVSEKYLFKTFNFEFHFCKFSFAVASVVLDQFSKQNIQNV